MNGAAGTDMSGVDTVKPLSADKQKSPEQKLRAYLIWSGRRCCLIGQVAAGIVVSVGFVND